MQPIFAFCTALFFASGASAQTIVITDVQEVNDTVEVAIETTIEGPIEIMVGVDLAGQAPDDIYIGAGEQITVQDGSAVASIPLTRRDGTVLPAGKYEAVAAFHPRWGAKNAPKATRAISDIIAAVPVEINLHGSGQAASAVAARDEMQRWVMLNIVVGTQFDAEALEERLGVAERITVTNRTGIILGWYYPDADMTIFENTLKGEVATWSVGRQNAL